MNDYKVMTEKNERQAMPCSYYYVTATSETEAIEQVYSSVKTGLLPFGKLSWHAVPDYTCAVLF